MANVKRYLHAGVIAFAVASAAPAGAAGPEERARIHYDRATELFSQGSYPEALVELQRAGELRPSYKLFHSIAQVHAAMNDFASAIDAYRKFLQQGGQKIAPERRREVNDEIAALTRRVASVTITADVPGAEVWVDETRVGTTPIRTPLLLNAGQRRITLRHPSFPERSLRVTAVAGVAERHEITLREDPAPKPEPAPALVDTPGVKPSTGALAPGELSPTEKAAVAGDAPRQSYAWMGWLATGVLAAGAVVTGVVALSSNSSLDDDRESANTPDGPTRAELESSASNLRALATVTDVLWVAAAAAGGVSLWLTLGSSDAETPQQGSGRPLRLLVNATGASIEGSF